MIIGISGSHGLIGSHLHSFFLNAGHQLIRIERDPSGSARLLDGCDIVIHLAGANLSAHRWTPGFKKEILSSRINSTEALVRVLTGLKRPPSVFFCASATGYYGAHPTQLFTEASPVGRGFLADVCNRWEAAALKAQGVNGIRVINLRFAPVLSLNGGMLKAMLPAFKLGLGGPLGNGSQFVNWIALEELAPIINFLISLPDFKGPVNCASPNSVPNIEFSRTLAGILGRPCVMPTPSTVIKILFGEMGEELLLKGANVLPLRLNESGYKFREPELIQVLNRLLK